MTKGVLYKFRTKKDLEDKIKSVPDNTYIVERTRRDNIWGDAGDGGSGLKGENWLGKILTMVSHYIKYGNADKMPHQLRKKVKIK